MKKRIYLLSIAAALTVNGYGQTYLDSTINSATKRIQFADVNQFSIGSYGEGHYNQAISADTYQNGTIDLHRVITFIGYKFNSNLQFFSEIEFEHVKEVYVEQAFLNYSFRSFLNFKAGVILIPMGYLNEFHEPTLFNGVERPNFNKYVTPTTWSEMGCGFHGIIRKANLKYQLYVVDGFHGYDGLAKISGKNGLRSARQKGAEAVMRNPALTGKIDFYGFNGLRLGLSGYYGKSESTLYQGLDKTDTDAIKTADSSSVGIAMVGGNLQYSIKGLVFSAETNYTLLSNTVQYNAYTGAGIGNRIFGYYAELAYRWQLKENKTYPQLIPFVRYENYDTHFGVDADISKNDSYHREELTAGVGYQITPGVIFKTDFQWVKNTANPRPANILNIGFGYWF